MEEKLVKFLQEDIEKLMKKMESALDNNDIGTYKNLMNALDHATKMIQYSKWETMFSEYYIDEDKQHKQVSVWKQKGLDIKDHKVWDVVNIPRGTKVVSSPMDENIYVKDLKYLNDLINNTFVTLDGMKNEQKECINKLKEDYTNKMHYSQIKNMFDRYIEYKEENKIIELPVTELIRGIGKTTYLFHKAMEDENGVFISNAYALKTLSEKFKDIYDSNRCIYVGDIDGIYKNGRNLLNRNLYIDEGFEYDENTFKSFENKVYIYKRLK